MATQRRRHLKKLRSRQRKLVNETLTAILEAEEDAKDKGKPGKLLTEADLKRVESEGLIKPEHLDIFVTWYAFSGMEKGLSISEILTLPAELLTDFKYLLRRLSELREKRPKEL